MSLILFELWVRRLISKSKLFYVVDIVFTFQSTAGFVRHLKTYNWNCFTAKNLQLDLFDS